MMFQAHYALRKQLRDDLLTFIMIHSVMDVNMQDL